MKALVLHTPGPLETHPLTTETLPDPVPGAGQILVRVHACGICRTDLHEIEGDVFLPRLPLVPGHQIVGTVAAVGHRVRRWRAGDRVGVGWLHWVCGQCTFCRRELENLCAAARFTGLSVDGGFAEYALAEEEFAFGIPPAFDDGHAAPLFCAGVTGYRALMLSNILCGEVLGLYGFGASGHLTLQIARHLGKEVFVFRSNPQHIDLARGLGAAWAGLISDPPPHRFDSAIVFSAGMNQVSMALSHLQPGGTVVRTSLSTAPISNLRPELLSQERSIRTVSNATRQDTSELLRLAACIPLRPDVTTFPWRLAEQSLRQLRDGQIRGAAVLSMD